MLIRRILLVAPMIVLLWAGPASAQSYGDVAGSGLERGGATVGGATVRAGNAWSGGGGGSQGVGDGDLARTGSNLTGLVQASVVLVGGGALLVLSGRRHGARRLAA